MSGVIGKVVSIEGKFFAKDQNGNIRELSKGDNIFEGETVIGDVNNNDANNIIVNLEDGSDIQVFANESQVFDAFLSKTLFTEDETVTDTQSINTITSLEDIDTASGEEKLQTSNEISSEGFAKIENEIVDITAKTRDVTIENENFQHADTSMYNLEQIDTTAFQNAINITNGTASQLDTLLIKSQDLIDTIQENPSLADIAVLEATILEIKDVNEILDNNINDLNNELELLNQQAKVLNEIIDISDAEVALENANDISILATDLVSTVESSLDGYKDSIVSEVEEDTSMLTQSIANTGDLVNEVDGENVNTTYTDAVSAEIAIDNLKYVADAAAVDANAAVAAAEDAADTLSDIENPTQAQIDEVQGLVDTANSEVSDAQAAKSAYESKADTESETKETITINSIDDAQTQTTVAQAENDSDNSPEASDDIGRVWVGETSNETIDSLQIGTFNHESAETNDWGDMVDGKAVFTQGNITVTTSVSDGNLTAYNSGGNSVGLGIGNNDRAGLDKTETLSVEIEGANANRVDFTLDGLGSYFDEKSRNATEVKITAYDADGNVIDNQGGYRESGQYEDVYSFETDVPVAKFEITSEGSMGNFVVQNMTLSATDSMVVPGHWESLNEDGSIIVDVLANDNDKDGDSLSISSVKAPTDAQGNVLGTVEIVTVDGKEQIKFTPNAKLQEMNDGENQDVSFEYTVSDGTSSDIGKVTVNVTGSNDVEDTNSNQNIDFRNADSSDSDKDYNDRTLTTGDGDDKITASGHIEDGVNITTGSGNDTIKFGGDVGDNSDSSTTKIDMGDGNDTLQGTGRDSDIEGGATINMGDGDNTISVDDIKNSTVTMGSGDDTIEVDDIRENATVNTGAGDDTISVNEINGDANVSMGDGADTLNIDGYVGGDATVDTGAGDDTLNVARLQESAKVDTGSGDDIVVVDNVSSGFDDGSVGLGEGDDTLIINDSLSGTDAKFDGGDGADKLVLTNVDKEHWDAGIHENFTNFESVTLSDGNTYTLKDDEIVYGDKDNIINVDNIIDENLDTNGGNDTLNITDDIEGNSTINTGTGNDTVTVGDDFDNGTLNTGTGNDTVTINDDLGDSNETATVNTDTGDDTVTVKGTMRNDSSINTGEGADTVNISRIEEDGTIETGSGDDSVTLDDVSSRYNGSVDLGTGDDTLTIQDNLHGTSAKFDGGEGTDKLVLTDVSQADWDDGVKDLFTNFESVTLEDGTTSDLTDSTVSEEEIETVETESETLTMLVSDEINIDFTAMENIPSSESQTNVNTENISLNLNDVLFDNNENVLDESNSIEETSDLVTEESSSEWTLGDFKTDAEIGITNQEVMGVDDQTLTLEINTEIMIDQN